MLHCKRYKNGLEYSPICGKCRGKVCLNSPPTEDIEIVDEGT